MWGGGVVLGGLVFPARAGMIHSGCELKGTSRGIPRESGDDPLEEHAQFRCTQYSPRERG